MQFPIAFTSYNLLKILWNNLLRLRKREVFREQETLQNQHPLQKQNQNGGAREQLLTVLHPTNLLRWKNQGPIAIAVYKEGVKNETKKPKCMHG